MNDEIWLPIVGYGDCYSVSNRGAVMRTAPRNIRRTTGRNAKPFKPSAVKAYMNRRGYMQVRIGPTGAQMTVSVHTLVARAFIPNPNNLREVNHKDADKTNNSDTNLEWVSRRQNMRHAFDNGLCVPATGERHARSKLTEADVLAIRADSRPLKALAAAFNTHVSNVSLIKRRRTWAHVPD
jgi:hypothetical protein